MNSTSRYQTLFNLLTANCVKSAPNSNIVMAPFMSQNKNPDANLTGFNTPEINSLLTTDNLCTMPHDLKIIFRILGQHNVECNFADWTIMSLQNINTRLNHVREDGQHRVVDFAILYSGMGHCIVCAYDPTDGKIFYRHDGGSSGWDRDHYYQFIKQYIPIEQDKYSFQHWLDEAIAKHDGEELYERFNRLPLINPN